MQVHRLYKRRLDRNTCLGLKLCLLWLAGLSLGFYAVRFCGDTPVSFLRRAAAVSGTGFSLLWVTAFPLLVSACAVDLSGPATVWWLCPVRAAALGYLSGGTVLAYRSAGMFVAALLLFSALSFSPFLLWYWWRRLCGPPELLAGDTLAGLAVCGAIWVMDLFWVSPYLADIMTF